MARTVTITPSANEFGSTIITSTVTDGTNTATSSFTVNVTGLNDGPTIAATEVKLTDLWG